MTFLAPTLTGAQVVTLSLDPSVCPAQSAHSSYSGSYLQADFRMTSGWLQDDWESRKQAFREHSEGTQRILQEKSESNQTSSYRRRGLNQKNTFSGVFDLFWTKIPKCKWI